MDIRASLPGSRFDIQAVQHGLPSRPLRCRLLEEALVRRFHLEITRESRLSDVYVMTAPDGHRMEESTPESLGASFASMDLHETLPSVDAADALPTPEAFRKAVSSRGFITSLEADAATVAELCDMLEGALDRPVVDETGIEGRFQIRLAGTAASNEEFFRMLDEQFGLVLTPGRRTVTTLVVQNA
jgi:uncharacterized protein (TIGR03435 family)